MKKCEYLGCNNEATATATASELAGTATQYDVCSDHVGQMDCVAVTGIAGDLIS